MYEHDVLLENILPQIKETKTWVGNKPYHFPTLSKDLKKLLEPYRIPTDTHVI
jgi:hypothetical protein